MKVWKGIERTCAPAFHAYAATTGTRCAPSRSPSPILQRQPEPDHDAARSCWRLVTITADGLATFAYQLTGTSGAI